MRASWHPHTCGGGGLIWPKFSPFWSYEVAENRQRPPRPTSKTGPVVVPIHGVIGSPLTVAASGYTGRSDLNNTAACLPVAAVAVVVASRSLVAAI